MSHSHNLVFKQNTPVGVLRSAAAITGQRDRELLARTLVGTLSELIHSQRITMYRIVPADRGMEAVLMAQTSRDPDPTDTSVSFSISDSTDFKTVLETGKESIKRLDDGTCHSIYPITDQQSIVGMLELISHQHSEIDSHLISAFLKVYSNYLTILDESETDTLTGLLNRRTFENNLEKIIEECSAEDNPLNESNTQQPARRSNSQELPHWLAVMDIDHFKRINDEFGHLYGDEVLLLLSRIMRRVFRQSDKLFRFGGEEFIVVLDRTDLENAKNVLERFRAAIENYHFPQVGRVTISIGFVCLNKADGPSSIVGRADQALYYAKDHGRNMVCFYDDLITAGKLAQEHYSDDIELF
jgi:diguanylate cyclase (GGDEF)-like protein